MTVWKIVTRQGIDYPGGIGAPEFMGSGIACSDPQ